MSLLGERLSKARTAKGLSQSELARKVGVKPQAIQAIEAGRVRTTRKLRELAAMLDKSPDWLMGFDEPAHLSAPAAVRTVEVQGIVAGGFWQEVTAAQVGDETSVPASPDPRFARLPQIAFRVVGDSMSDLVRDGEYVLCIDNQKAPQSIRDGDVVVAERRRAGEFERTVKLVRHRNGGALELWPANKANGPGKPLQLSSREADTEVVILGLVIGYFRQA